MQKRMAFVFICIPVSPGRSRVIWIFPRNFGLWIDKVVPRWIFHLKYNLVFDSDLYLLHMQVVFLFMIAQLSFAIYPGLNRTLHLIW
jgi:hypothetical protein